MDREEFEQGLLSVDAHRALERLEKDFTLGQLFPEVQAIVGFGGDGRHKDLWWHTRHVVRQSLPNEIVRWAALFHDVGKPYCFKFERGKVSFYGHEARSAKLWNQAAKRLGWWTEEERKKIRFIIYHLGHIEGYEPNWTDSAVRRVGTLLGEHWGAVMAVARADITTKHDHKRKAHHARMAELSKRWRDIQTKDAKVPALPTGLGNVLMTELGLSGRELGACMRELKAAVEAEKLPRQAEPSVYVAWARGSHDLSRGVGTGDG